MRRSTVVIPVRDCPGLETALTFFRREDSLAISQVSNECRELLNMRIRLRMIKSDNMQMAMTTSGMCMRPLAM